MPLLALACLTPLPVLAYSCYMSTRTTTRLRRVNGPSVRALREAVGIKHGVFAIDCLISPGYLTNIEKGLKQPSPAVTAVIAARLGVPLDAITYSVEVAA